MLTTHKISEDFYDDNFQLIAIHSGLEDFAMGYAVNLACGLQLSRRKNDLQFDQDLAFSVFDWDDELSDTFWTLMSNKCAVEETIPSVGLFQDRTSSRADYLIKERKEVDYFLKVDGVDGPTLVNKIKAINTIPKVVTAYPLETQTLKSKRNLIF
ncbi:IPExxxVDY family protein [Flagellimonas algicola]|uniref:IPExxxVDY family protein n=1 Tax=Flagellimonas algicola TaxID=2583815 RepID=A0ABY2WKT4_9FLAO|nr:IPExxxVDY family protein [Allomuricauda algicola]TMU55235.1 IPExxxVDY family protein [Allomuricauda algicola]